MRNIGWIPLAAAALMVAACGSSDGGNGGGTGPTPNAAPTPAFESVCAELTCTFTDRSTDADGSVTGWQWSFGDGATSTEENPVHEYAAAQPYDVTLKVTDNAGTADSATQPVTPTAPSVDLTCTDAATPGTDATCSFTLPAAASVKAVLSSRDPCQAHGDVFAFTAPVADTLTTDGCFDPIGIEADLAASPSGTQVAIAIRSGLAQYTTGVRVTGQYPEWTIYVEDAVGASFPTNYTDMVVTLTATPSP